MSTKHTPGPWVAVYNDHYWDIKLESSYERIGDTCASEFLSSGDNGKANARLIAAAPELLEALKLMIETYPYSPPCYGWQEQVHAHKSARAALKKANGEEA